MSLNDAERHRTCEEFAQNLALARLTPHEAAADLGFAPERLRRTLDAASTSDPVDVWQLRDYLRQAVVDSGGTPVRHTVLTERSRLKARMWFSLRRAPRHDFTAPGRP
ncbi:DUF2316 family protein [Streptomyces sp. NPDC091272]|uniref:DUF2316 family protein n=1 Tax=Streptomyces sp. NPDC091272 TaxID=3365981 RepID=UPI003815EA7A